MQIKTIWFLGRPNNYYSGKDRKLEGCVCNGGKIARVGTVTTNPRVQPTTTNKIRQPLPCPQAKCSKEKDRMEQTMVRQ